MTVAGRWRPGLLIDPGACTGLIGTDTLREIIQYVLKPLGLDHLIRWTRSSAPFAGISAAPQQSLGLVTFPIGLWGLEDSTFTADTLGGDGSGCPGLVPLSTLIQLGCVMAFNHFSNCDGLLGI